MSSLLIDVICGPLRAPYVEYWRSLLGEVYLLLSEKAEACCHVLPCHIGTALLLPLLLLTLGLWYVVDLAGTGFSPVAREI